MKLPFDLGVKLIFRLLVPGFILMLGVRPILLTVVDAAGAHEYQDLACVVATLILGWIVTLLDLPIYMAFEGRRFWPERLWQYGVARETARLKRWQDAEQSNYDISKSDSNPIHRRRYLEASVELRRFPLDEDTGEYTAMFPTRLGNAVTAFEQYPDTRYGADAIFFFSRIWTALDKDAKEDLDTQQALADGALYSSAAIAVTGLLWVFHAVLPRIVPSLHYTATPRIALLTGVLCLAASFGLYRAAIYVNDQFGATFRAIFDLKLPAVQKTLLAPGGVLGTVGQLTSDFSVRTAREHYKIVWRYLQNYRVKCPRCGKVVAPPQLSTHPCS